MTKLAWSRDGDQYVARGIMGEYRISEWIFATGSEFTLNVRRKGDGACKNIGGFSTVANAKTAAENYDGYRSVAA